MTTTALHERNHPVKTAPQTQPPRVVTREDHDKARKAIEELERIERLVTSVLIILGVGGLIFTAVNVTLFAVDHDTHWAIAWMLDPLASISLLAALFIDGKLAAHGYKPGGWPFLLRWFAGIATWLMNCWGALYPDGQFTGWPDHPDPAGLLLHSVVPFLVVFLAEAGAGYRKFSLRKKQDYRATVDAWKQREEDRRRTEQQAREQQAEAERAAAEAERKRTAELADEEKRAALEVQKARELAEAKAREIRAASEAEARSAETARRDAEARSRAEAEARERQARLDRENAEHLAGLERQRILTEAQAAAEKTRAEAEVKAAAEAREERRRAAEARRASTAIPTAETTALPAGEPTAKPRKLTAIPTAIPTAPTAETDDVRGAEAKRKQIEEATFEAAVLLFMGDAPTRKDFAAQYGRGETWGRDRYAEADQLMANDADYEARVLGEAEKRTAKDEQVSA